MEIALASRRCDTWTPTTSQTLAGASGSGLKECTKVVDLRADGGEWLIVGCIYKDQPLKPSILDEFR